MVKSQFWWFLNDSPFPRILNTPQKPWWMAVMNSHIWEHRMGVFNRNGGMRLLQLRNTLRVRRLPQKPGLRHLWLEMLWGDRTGSTRALRWETPTRFHISIFCNLYGVLYIYIYTHTQCVCVYTGRTQVALVELPTVNMFDFFFYTPFPLES